MAMPDIGVGPPPPVDVSAQMRPTSSGAGGGLDLAGLLAQLGGGQAPAMGPDITPKVMEVQPLLSQLARQVPALGPDVDRLNVELKSHMAGLPNMLAQLGGASGGPAPAPGGGGSPDLPAGPSGAADAQAAPPPPNPEPAGAMDTAMQLEIKLPAIGKDDPTLMPYVQGFIARMREEVPKVVQGETESVNPPTQAAPTDSMLSKIPVTF